MSKSTEKHLLELINSDVGKKYNLQSSISEINEVPIDNFEKIVSMLLSGKALIRIYPSSIDGTTFNLVSSSFEGYRSLLYSFITFVIPIISLILAFTHAWQWIALMILAPYVGFKLSRGLYTKVICKKACESEIIFSYLFSAWKITIELPGKKIISRKNM